MNMLFNLVNHDLMVDNCCVVFDLVMTWQGYDDMEADWASVRS